MTEEKKTEAKATPEKKAEPEVLKYIVSSSPHTHSGASVKGIMIDVIIALLPALAMAVYFFRMDAVRLVSTCIFSCVATEYLCRKLMKRDSGIGDYSAVLTGILLAFNLPPSLPCWMAVVGSIASVAIAKQVFGGLGYNPFNPALVGRVALLISFPVAMTTWHAPFDATTSATPLGTLKEAGVYGFDSSMVMQYLIGNMNGCIGEVSAAALILGGIYLLMRKVITWHIPVSYLATVGIFAALLWMINGEVNMPPHFHLLVGGVMIGAIFMATDMVTSPVTKKGMIVFGAGCGILTMLIRRWGGYPEGVSFAILLMNSVTPLINRAAKPRVFGVKKP